MATAARLAAPLQLDRRAQTPQLSTGVYHRRAPQQPPLPRSRRRRCMANRARSSGRWECVVGSEEYGAQKRSELGARGPRAAAHLYPSTAFSMMMLTRQHCVPEQAQFGGTSSTATGRSSVRWHIRTSGGEGWRCNMVGMVGSSWAEVQQRGICAYIVPPI